MENDQPWESSIAGSIVSIISNFKDVSWNIEILDVPNWIASVKFKSEVEEIRLLIRQYKHQEAQEKKQKLLAFTPSATFNQKRLSTEIKQYSGFVHLDFDKLTPEQRRKKMQAVKSIH